MKKLLLLAMLVSSCALYSGEGEEEKGSDSLVASLCCDGGEEGEEKDSIR
ncbi:hypothetical protein [Chlamydia sp.]|nr:hypothetical protein [Chlamydia sp.]MBQ8498621.1 hypothetical protein [Chlamydia sp.]